MKKLIYGTAIAALLLGACGETETEKVEGTVEKEETTAATTETTKEEAPKEEAASNDAINQVIVDDEKHYISLLEIVKEKDEIWGNKIDVVFEVENRTDKLITVQAGNISADGYMVDETIAIMSQDVSPGKKAKAVLSIMEMEGYDFPELNSDLELTLRVSDETFMEIEEIPVKVSF